MLLCLVAKSCLTLCDPKECSLSGSSVHGNFQARVLEWVAIPFSRKPSCCFIFVPCYETLSKLFNMSTFWKVNMLVAQLCLALCNPVDISSPGSSVHGISQARILEWVAIPFSRGSSWPRDWTWVSCIVGRRFTVWTTRKVINVFFQMYFFNLFMSEYVWDFTYLPNKAFRFPALSTDLFRVLYPFPWIAHI